MSLTVDALVDLPAVQDISISKSSQVTYSLSDRTKKLDKELTSSIWVAEVGKQHSSKQLTSGLFNDKSPKWSPDGETIAFLSDRAKAGESSAIYLISVKGGEAYPITKADNNKPISSFSWCPNGKFIAFTSADEKSDEREAKEKKKDDAKVYGEEWEYSRLRCIHVASREVSTLFASDSHVNNFVWSNPEEIVFILHRIPDLNSPIYHGVEFRAVSLSNKESTLLSRFPGDVSDLADSAGAIHFIAGANPKSTCTSSTLYQLRVSPEKEKVVTKLAFGVDSCALELREFADCVAIRVQKGMSEQIHRLGQNFPETYSISIFHDERYALPTWNMMEIEEKNDDGDITSKHILCFGKSEGEGPTEIFSKVEDEIVQLSNHGGAIANLHVMDTTVIYCEAKDGIKIDAVFHTPSSVKEKKKLPTVVTIHGGPYSHSSTSFDSSTWHWAPWLVSAGYAVLCPNYRGSSGYGDEFASASKGGMGTKDYDDVISLLQKGISEGYIDEKRVAIAGQSQGGFLSYLAVTRPDFHFKAAVCASGVTDWDHMSFVSDAPGFESDLAGGAPWETAPNSTAARHGSAIWHMKNVKTPVLILHGENDVRCPLSNAVAFHRGCLHYGVDCEFVVYPREGHNIAERQHRVDVLNRLRRFIDLHLSA